jgi:dimethylaniline monooxygenase (N-oxide forming)
MAMIDLIEDTGESVDDASSGRVCVIGAGASGIAVCRALAIRDIAFDCYERGDQIGGLWRYPQIRGGSCAYQSLHANTSRTVMQYPSFPMPEEYPHYPHHSLVARYFDEYVDHHQLRSRIQLGSEVKALLPHTDGGWDVALADGRLRSYRSVAVASGARHAEPIRPEIPGEFNGTQLHAFDYDRPEPFAGQSVAVVGLGASGADIACDLAAHAKTTYLAARTGHYIVPKLVRGHPIDLMSPLMRRVSPEMRRPLLSLLLKIVNGEMTDYGLPQPPYPPGKGPLIASTELLPAIAHGKVIAKPAIERLTGDEATFADGSSTRLDAIIYCTGYRIAFPFLDPSIAVGGEDAPPLYRMLVAPEQDGLYFIGLLHSTMALMPLAEAQSEWLGDLLTGEVALPSRADMWTAIRAERLRQDKRFHDTSGHMLVDPGEYERLIARERRTHLSGQHVGSRT